MKKILARILVATFITTIIPNGYTFNNVYANTDYTSNQENVNKDEKWDLKWEDNFDGDSLNLDDWNYEIHEPGWVNNELQAYTDDIKNVYIDDGKLVLKAIKEGTGSDAKYTSGKVTTQNKHDYKYGRFEASLKVPEGQGLWPAFWMMPTEENLYGSWPRCGEIDIMEVLGNEPNKAYGTIHYGNPHKSDQGTYILDKGTFADDYHVFAVEWEPSEMRFYIDGHLYHTINDWFTKQEGGDEITYPAPFDQTFFLKFNLAVGGNWPGNPNDSTNFDNAEYKIDYVKVYQLKEGYNENVPKPEKPPVDLRDPDTTGNYINNGDFSENENLDDDTNWKTLTALGGEGSSVIKDNKIILSSENGGTVDYSLQLVQAAVPLKKNGVYQLSFDAKAAETRNMLVNITSPTRSYIRQLPDTLVDLTNVSKNYSYKFTMKDDDDANTRLEFNYGNRGSLADIEITNVRLEKIGQNEPVAEEVKTILPDGNYVYNGTFDVGADRMKYWNVESKIDNVQSLVTNINNEREFKINVPTTVSSLSDVILKESELGIVANKEYSLSFDAYAEEDKTIKAQINDEIFEAKITKEKKNFKYKLKTEDILKNKNLEFLLGVAGVTYIDNVKITDTSLIINGDFNNEFSKWEVFRDGSVSSGVSSSINKSNGNNAAKIDISNTGDADWKIQLKQTGVKLEKGKKYKLSLDAKSTLGRKIMFTIQKDGSSDNDWTPYATTQIVDLQNEYNNYSVIFEMTKNSDLNSIFSMSMGAVAGTQITELHSIYIDNIKLVEVTDIELNTNDLFDYISQAKKIITSDSFNNIVESDAKNLINILDKAEKLYKNAILENTSVTQEEINAITIELKNSISNLRNKADTSLIINGNFNNEFSNWEVFKDSSVASSVASSIDTSNGNNAAKIDISNTGDADWKIQLKQTGVKLEKGKKYKLSLDAKSTLGRKIMFTLQRDGSGDNDWRPYAGTQIVDLKNEYNNYEVIFEMTENSDLNSIFSMSMGAVENIQINDAHSIYIDNINLVEVIDIKLNTEDLLKYINQAKEIISSGSFNNIVESDAKNLIAILDKAEKLHENAISENPSVTQEEIDTITTDLKNSISTLRKKDEDNNVDNDSDDQTPPGNVNNGSNNKIPEQDVNNDKNTNSTLVNTGEESYLGLLGILLIVCGSGITFITLNRKHKKAI